MFGSLNCPSSVLPSITYWIKRHQTHGPVEEKHETKIASFHYCANKTLRIILAHTAAFNSSYCDAAGIVSLWLIALVCIFPHVWVALDESFAKWRNMEQTKAKHLRFHNGCVDKGISSHYLSCSELWTMHASFLQKCRVQKGQ